MQSVSVNAFSFLQKKLAAKGQGSSNIQVSLDPDMCVADIITSLGLDVRDVEGAFVNGLIQPFDTVLHGGDRVALVPPGTPGPYRYLLGIRGEQGETCEDTKV